MKTSYHLDSGPVRRSQPNIEFAMTPMIDVIFLLLVFFLATSSFRAVEKLLPSALSQSKPTQGDQDTLPPEELNELLEQVVVKLRQQAGVVVAEFNGTPLDNFADLQFRLISIAQLQTSLPVIIAPEPTVTADRVVRAYDWARAVGLTQVYLTIDTR